MINIDPDTGDASGVALKVLAGYRRERANIFFGQFLARSPEAPASADGVSTGMSRRSDREREEEEDAGGGVDGMGRVCGVEQDGKAKGGAVSVWEAWVWEGMEVAGEA